MPDVIILTYRDKKNFKNFKWAMLASTFQPWVEPKRYHETVLIKSGKLYCTDCNRLHSVDVSDVFDEGVYRVLANQQRHIALVKIDTVEWPFNLDELLCSKSELNTDPFEVSHPGKNREYVDFSFLIQKIKTPINFKYYLDVISGHDLFMCEFVNENSPIVFRNCTKVAAIMPMRE